MKRTWPMKKVKASHIVEGLIYVVLGVGFLAFFGWLGALVLTVER